MNKPDTLLTIALRNLGIESLNPMQEAALQAASERKDVILLSPTGSGKTLAFLLPLLEQLQPDAQHVQCLILAPLRELALQTDQVFKQMGTPFRSCCCYGGHSVAEEKNAIVNTRPAVVIGTPGRVLDHILRGVLEPEFIRTLIIDEFDKSLELGFRDEMAEIVGQLSGLKKRVLLSATDSDEIPQFTGLGRTVKLNFLEDGLVSQRLDLRLVISPEKDKLETLYRLLCTLGNRPTIVFVNYREAVERVGGYLASKGMENGTFHGGMEQEDRERALYKFRNGSCHVFISTDLAARGLDIPEIENIIHYHMPISEEAFIHRNGRTARWDADGNAFLLLHAAEKLPAYLTEVPDTFVLPEHTPKPLPSVWVTLYIGKGKKDKLSKIDIVGFLYKKGGLGKDDIGRIDVKDHYAFVAVRRKKLKQMLQLIQGEKIKGMKTIIEESK